MKEVRNLTRMKFSVGFQMRIWRKLTLSQNKVPLGIQLYVFLLNAASLERFWRSLMLSPVSPSPKSCLWYSEKGMWIKNFGRWVAKEKISWITCQAKYMWICYHIPGRTISITICRTLSDDICFYPAVASSYFRHLHVCSVALRVSDIPPPP